jgi:hypothetical protein
MGIVGSNPTLSSINRLPDNIENQKKIYSVQIRSPNPKVSMYDCPSAIIIWPLMPVQLPLPYHTPLHRKTILGYFRAPFKLRFFTGILVTLYVFNGMFLSDGPKKTASAGTINLFFV